MIINRRHLLGTMAAALAGSAGFARTGFGRNRQPGSALNSTPTADGFRMPGEFEPQEAIWLAWPEEPTWRMGGKPAEKVIAKLAAIIAEDIPVRLAASHGQVSRVRSLVPDSVEVVTMHADTGWIRDDGATFLIDEQGDRRGVDWVFNAWGYPEHFKDTNKTARRMIAQESALRYRAPLVLEGGSIHSDGHGTIITTEECLLNPNRNPELTKEDIEQHLVNYLGAKKIIWLPVGVFKDGTSGHVDNMCCFARPSEVLLTWTDDQEDAQYHRSRRALDILNASTDANGKHFKVHKLHQPGPLYMNEQELDTMPELMLEEIEWSEGRLAGSYINYILTNRRVIFPLLDPETDAEASATLARAFPDREIIGLQSREILLHGGNLHCISQNLPARRGGV